MTTRQDSLQSQLLCTSCRRENGFAVVSTGLQCQACKTTHPVVGGRPVMAGDDARTDGSIQVWTDNAGTLGDRASAKSWPALENSDVESHFFGKLFPHLKRREPHWGFLGRKVAEMTRAIPADAAVLDVGAGECKYGALLPGRRYVGTDLVFSSDRHDFSLIDVISEASNLPFKSGVFDVVLNMVVMEHVPDPGRVVAEMARVLKSDGKIYALIPLVRPEHLQPYDFQRFTRFGITRLLEQNGFKVDRIEPSNGALWTAVHYARLAALDQPLKRYGRRSFAGRALNRIWAVLMWPLTTYARATNDRYDDCFPMYFWVEGTVTGT